MSTTTNCGIQTSRQQSKFNKSWTKLKVDNFVEVATFDSVDHVNFVTSVYRPLVLHATGMKGHLAGEDGSACDEFEDNEGGILR